MTEKEPFEKRLIKNTLQCYYIAGIIAIIGVCAVMVALAIGWSATVIWDSVTSLPAWVQAVFVIALIPLVCAIIKTVYEEYLIEEQKEKCHEYIKQNFGDIPHIKNILAVGIVFFSTVILAAISASIINPDWFVITLGDGTSTFWHALLFWNTCLPLAYFVAIVWEFEDNKGETPKESSKESITYPKTEPTKKPRFWVKIEAKDRQSDITLYDRQFYNPTYLTFPFIHLLRIVIVKHPNGDDTEVTKVANDLLTNAEKISQERRDNIKGIFTEPIQIPEEKENSKSKEELEKEVQELTKKLEEINKNHPEN